MAKLWAFGCSMTYGADLFCPEEDRWSKQLADALGMEEQNWGKSGASNPWIQRTFLRHMHSIDQEDLVIIMWTHPARIETKSKSGDWIEKGWIGSNGAGRIDNRYKIAWNMYSDHLTNPYIDWLRSMQIQYATYQILKVMGIKFVFCHWSETPNWHYLGNLKEFHCIYNGEEQPRDVEQLQLLKGWQQEMLPNYFVDEFFLEYCAKNKWPLGETLHPMETTHIEWTKLLVKHLDTII